MKVVETNRPKTTTFNRISHGFMFRWNGHYFIKVSPSNGHNAVGVDGCWQTFTDDTIVISYPSAQIDTGAPE